MRIWGQRKAWIVCMSTVRGLVSQSPFAQSVSFGRAQSVSFGRADKRNETSVGQRAVCCVRVVGLNVQWG